MKSLPSIFARVAIEFYRWCISPFLPVACRFHPTCSCYAKDALKMHGFFRGGLFALVRILKCNPFGPSGFDPVPPATHTPIVKN